MQKKSKRKEKKENCTNKQHFRNIQDEEKEHILQRFKLVRKTKGNIRTRDGGALFLSSSYSLIVGKSLGWLAFTFGPRLLA
jgi:hypothetical protein